MAEENTNNNNPIDDNSNANNQESGSRLENPSASVPDDFNDDLGDRLERLGGEPAPVITPEEFARLQKAGQVHIDSRGRVRTARRTGSEAGVSLRKRRAWYGK